MTQRSQDFDRLEAAIEKGHRVERQRAAVGFVVEAMMGPEPVFQPPLSEEAIGEGADRVVGSCKRPLRIYVASSWRNAIQPAVVHVLRRCGHHVYDFRNPCEGNEGFQWRDVDSNWKTWSTDEYRRMLWHPVAESAYHLDMKALSDCDACVLVMPAGRSASFELGYAMALQKDGYVLHLAPPGPDHIELMFRQATILDGMKELFDTFGLVAEAPPGPEDHGTIILTSDPEEP